MFFDIRLWQFTRGVRLRIAATVVMGVLASLAGMGRLALLGWLLARVFAGDTFFRAAPAVRARGGGDGAPRLDRAHPRHGRPPYRGDGAAGAAQAALRKGERWDAKSSMRRSKAYRGFAAEFLDAVQGLETLSRRSVREARAAGCWRSARTRSSAARCGCSRPTRDRQNNRAICVDGGVLMWSLSGSLSV